MYSVIIVEDDPMVRKLNSDYVSEYKQLEIKGLFDNGNDALEFLRSGNKADLIILDIYMPVMDGKEFIEQLRSEGYETAVIPVTAANDSASLKKLSAHGIVDYLVKPFDKQRFSQAIARFLNYISIVSKKQPLSQNDINSLFVNTSPAAVPASEKGLQQKTLDLVMQFFNENKNQPLTTDIISKNTGLSLVTARHYANHLAKCKIVEHKVNYSTGGRPSNIYMLK